MGSQGKEIKVTDKRMFTPEGELREEYRFLSEKSTPEAPPVPETPPVPEARTAPPQQPEAPRRVEPEPPPRRAATMEMDMDMDDDAGLGFPGSGPGMGPSFYDLAAMLAEPAAIYLGDAPLPDGQWAENLEMARLHIDLLDILRQKTTGNLAAQESAFLEDLLYRLRVRYVQKRG